MSLPIGYRQTAVPRMSPEQMNLFNQLLGHLGGGSGGSQGYGVQGLDLLSKLGLGDQSSYEQLQQPALNQFNQQIIPELAQRFGMGGTLKSSSFNNAVTGAAGNLSSNLAAQRSQLQREALSRLLGLQQSLLGQQPYEYGLQKESSIWDKLSGLLGGLGGIGAGIGAFL